MPGSTVLLLNASVVFLNHCDVFCIEVLCYGNIRRGNGL